jgi:hypothetical protein
MAFQLAGSNGMQAFLGELERDLERLRQHASDEGWTDETAVGLPVLDARHDSPRQGPGSLAR